MVNYLKQLNSNYSGINYKIDANSAKFRDTKVIRKNGTITRTVNRTTKAARNKKNEINSDLIRAVRIANIFTNDITKIWQKF